MERLERFGEVRKLTEGTAEAIDKLAGHLPALAVGIDIDRGLAVISPSRECFWVMDGRRITTNNVLGYVTAWQSREPDADRPKPFSWLFQRMEERASC